ncbi:hypothetical protein AWN76_005030 [Rhodothermaceae bacterium RA]|nr:hypothetical protein AWN76_005030 [Rhodothermaceae bacterium RA]
MAFDLHAMHRIARYSLGLMLCLCALARPHDGRAQAWPQGTGQAYVKLAHGRSTAAEQYTFDGRLKPYADHVDGEAFFDRSAYLYMEYGVREHLTVVGMLPFKDLRVLDAAFAYETGGVGSALAGVRLGLKPLLGWSAPRQALALNLMLTLPTGYTRNLAPAIGAGQVDVQALLAWGLSLYPLPGYAQLGAGYRHRTGLYALSRATPCQPGRDLHCVRDVRPDYADEWLLSAEVGTGVGRWALLQVLGQAVLSVQPPDAASSFSANNPIPERQRYVKTGAGLSLYPTPALGLSLQAFLTPYGRNTIRSVDWFIGLEIIQR